MKCVCVDLCTSPFCQSEVDQTLFFLVISSIAKHQTLFKTLRFSGSMVWHEIKWNEKRKNVICKREKWRKKCATTTNTRQFFFNIIINYKQIHGVNKYVITLRSKHPIYYYVFCCTECVFTVAQQLRFLRRQFCFD